MKSVFVAFASIVIACATAPSQTIRLEDIDLSAMDIGWGSPQANLSDDGNPISIAGTKYAHGVGTHAVSKCLLTLNGNGRSFSASVGVDDEANDRASVEFMVFGDRKLLWKSGVMKKGDPAKVCTVALEGIKLLGLYVGDAADGIDYDHADWADAVVSGMGNLSPHDLTAGNAAENNEQILTPPAPETPRINGARVFGARPGHLFLFTIAATGKRPLRFGEVGLPQGLTVDPASGRITGTVFAAGTYPVRLTASNALGSTERELRIEIGDRICLTPPMGWNSWNCWACAVDDQKVRSAADAMVSSGLADHGWSYINIDDCWEIKPATNDSLLRGEARASDGRINTNRKFPDMKSLAEYVHEKGLKIGIYSSPGPLTCAGFTASYLHEADDARQYASWGIDYLKYDWCSYGKIAKDRSLPELRKPYAVMRRALDAVDRDIVYSLCQYGMGNVWEWGAEVGGNCWRTTGDIVDTWSSMSGIGFGQAGHEVYAGPGHWNDPDMLVVGLVGWGPSLHPSNLKPNEQYTHISLWSLLSAPLLIGCDLDRMDDFTKNLLMNDEVIAVNQDPLGKQARRIFDDGATQLWVKDLEDGSKAVGLFWVGGGGKDPVDLFKWDGATSRKITVTAQQLGLTGPFAVRDLWRQKDLGVFVQEFSAEVGYHGVVLVRISSAGGGR